MYRSSLLLLCVCGRKKPPEGGCLSASSSYWPQPKICLYGRKLLFESPLFTPEFVLASVHVVHGDGRIKTV